MKAILLTAAMALGPQALLASPVTLRVEARNIFGSDQGIEYFGFTRGGTITAYVTYDSDQSEPDDTSPFHGYGSSSKNDAIIDMSFDTTYGRVGKAPYADWLYTYDFFGPSSSPGSSDRISFYSGMTAGIEFTIDAKSTDWSAWTRSTELTADVLNDMTEHNFSFVFRHTPYGAYRISSNDLLFTEVDAVPEAVPFAHPVPLPASIPLLAMAFAPLIGFGTKRRRRRPRAMSGSV